jgi:DNA-binding transcriptional LysR family regulator
MRIDHLDGLVAFRCVAQSKSFTAAAAQLEVSPQAVSQTVKALEARLGVRLFHRTTRSVSLNEAGERLWATVGGALTDLFDATEAVQEFRDRPAGLLRIGVSRPAFMGLLQPVIAGFHKSFPDIRLELSFDDGFVDIVAQGLDAGVRLGDSVAQDMVSVRVSESEPIAILGSPDYLKRRGSPKVVADLAEHDCIRFRFPGSGAVFRWELIDGGRQIEMEVKGPVTVNDAGSMLSCAAEGLGLAYAIEGTASNLIRSGALVKVLASAAPVLPGFHLYYASRRQVPLKLRCFIDYMVGRLRTPSPRRSRHTA